MVAEDELMESEEVDDALAWNDTRYLLLKGDCDGGEGDIVLSHGSMWASQTRELASDLCMV